MGRWLFGGLFAIVAALPLQAEAQVRASQNDPKTYEIPYYTGVVLPVPQEVEYFDEFIPLSNVGLLPGKGMDKDDARLKLLKDRIVAAGGKVEVIDSLSKGCETVIALGDTALAGRILKKGVPAHAEGYAIQSAVEDGVNVVVLKGGDKLGELWSVVSFNQLVTKKDGKAVVRKAALFDFPAATGRCYTTGPWAGTGRDWALFAVLAKLDAVYFNRESHQYGDKRPDYWRRELTSGYKAELKEIGDLLNPLGVEWYDGLHLASGKPEEKISSKGDVDFEAAFKIASMIAGAGGGVFIEYDDTRFPISPADQADFGSAREADIYFINRLYTALKGKFPDAKLAFCPPFYWGPSYRPDYPDDRDEYLSAIGARLPKDIGVVWTGPAVNSGKISKRDVEWITKLIQRKPLIWQNGMGAPHAYGYHYVTDPLTSWRDWYYDGFLNDLSGYMLSTNMPLNCSALLTMNDAFWNPGAYDAGRSIADAAGKLAGPETYPSLVKLNKTLSWFDQYAFTVSMGAAKNISGIREKVKELEACWTDCLKLHPAAVRKWTSLERHVGQQRTFLAKLEKNPDLDSFVKQVEDAKALAIKEAGYNPALDVFFSPHDFSGANTPRLYSFNCERRLMVHMNGLKSNFSKASAGFHLAEPPTSDYELAVSGQDNDSGPVSRIQIVINDNVVYEGENGFARLGWSVRKFPVKGSFLHEGGGNRISFQCVDDSGNTMGPPFFILNYAVLKKGK